MTKVKTKRAKKAPAKGNKPENRMKSYVDRQKEKGLKIVSLWVPADRVFEVRKFADDLRRKKGIKTSRSAVLYGGRS